MFKELFSPYRILWVTFQTTVTNNVHRLIAYPLVQSREVAERLVEQFYGFEWFGYRLVLNIKEKRVDMAKQQVVWKDTEDLSDPNMLELESYMPELEPCSSKFDSITRTFVAHHEPPRNLSEVMVTNFMHDCQKKELMWHFPDFVAQPDLEDLYYPDMPELEPCSPKFDSITRTFVAHHEPPQNLPEVMVTNFRDDCTEEDLRRFFREYKPGKINIVSTQNGRRKASIELRTVDDVRSAVKTRDQCMYRGLRLKVDVPFSETWLRQLVLDDGTLQAPVSATSADWTSVSDSLRLTTLSEILIMRSKCVQTLQVPETPLYLGQKIQVLVTCVINDQFFWGQITDKNSQQRLRRISNKLRVIRPMVLASGPGRALAIFQGDKKWHRAWIMHTGLLTNEARVFFMDYGNVDTIPWSRTGRVTDPDIWNLQPMAVPFTLIDPVVCLKEREMTNLWVEVNAFGSLNGGNVVVVKALSLLPKVTLLDQTIVL